MKQCGGVRRVVVSSVAFLLAYLAADAVAAQQITIGLGEGGGVTERAVQLVALITVLSLAPSILIMVTSFTRIVVVLSLLRTALGTQQAPPNSVMISLALFLTVFVMAPVFERAYETAVKPLIAEQVDINEALEEGSKPFRAFMMHHVREKDLALFQGLAGTPEQAAGPQEIKMQVLIPAFMISELRRAFEIGFLLFVPFIVIDMVVASVLMSMGMMMLPPILISLPFKLVFFVLVDGWHLIAGSLLESFNP